MSVARLRPLAEADLVERFFEAAVASRRGIEKMPDAGSPRVGELRNVAGLRVRRVPGFPVGWFFFVRPDHGDVVRLLSDAQYLPVILADLDPV